MKDGYKNVKEAFILTDNEQTVCDEGPSLWLELRWVAQTNRFEQMLSSKTGC